MKKTLNLIKNFFSIRGKNNSFPINALYQKGRIRVKGNNNRIIIGQETKLNCTIKIHGNNNIVEIKDASTLRGEILIFGNNNSIKCGKNSNIKINLSMGFNKSFLTFNSYFSIGSNCYIGGAKINILEKNSGVKIGNNTILSHKITFWASDTHSIISEDGKLTNRGKEIYIGNNCWIAYNVTFVKNTKILDGSVVGLGSIVTKSFNKEKVLIAGNPAHILKENIIWDKQMPDVYLNSIQEN